MKCITIPEFRMLFINGLYAATKDVILPGGLYTSNQLTQILAVCNAHLRTVYEVLYKSTHHHQRHHYLLIYLLNEW